LERLDLRVEAHLEVLKLEILKIEVLRRWVWILERLEASFSLEFAAS
jgi:hypothetical protein